MRSLALLLLAIGGCHETRPPRAPLGDPCTAACANMRLLECDDWEDEPDAPCEKVCANVQSTGVISMEPECVALVASCEEAQRCVDARE